MKTLIAGSLSIVALLIFSWNASAHKVGDLSWCYQPTTLHQECIYRDEASCETARKTIADYMKSRAFKNAPDEVGAKAIELVCMRNPDKVDGGRSDVFGRAATSKGSD